MSDEEEIIRFGAEEEDSPPAGEGDEAAPADNVPAAEKVEFQENPYATDTRRPEDVVRLFYAHNVPILPVVSNREMLIGILRKEDVIAELSDIERASRLKIDEFITGLAHRMSLDDLIEHAKIREFITINIFGEVQGKWPRIQLFDACEGVTREHASGEAERHKEEQILEWMIYLILEHIPRALYAFNEAGKTIFYNSHFEELCAPSIGEVDIPLVERSFTDPDRNEPISGKDGQVVRFYNSELKIGYEKVPLFSKKKRVGYLIFCDTAADTDNYPHRGGKSDVNLREAMATIERQIIVDALKREDDLNRAAEALGLTRKALIARAEKLGISL